LKTKQKISNSIPGTAASGSNPTTSDVELIPIENNVSISNVNCSKILIAIYVTS
jgi:hypothetical protein